MGTARPLLWERFTELRSSIPHLALNEGFTPVRPLNRLPGGTAPVWLKDDGAFGSGPWGGNKVRKLEWILPDVRRRGAGTILSAGGLATNWGLATALYARQQGIATALELLDQPLDEPARRQRERLENSGATLHLTRTLGRSLAMLPWLLWRHRGPGLPYLLPPGGSSRLGALGYVEAALEIGDQVQSGELPEPSHVVIPVGSSGTAAGLHLGLRLAGLRTRVVGVLVADQLPHPAFAISWLARRAQRLLRRRGAALPLLDLDAVRPWVLDAWLGAGYGHSTPAGREAQALAGEREGLELDPVYTAKAFAALLAENAAGRFGQGPILYLHTYGRR